MKSYIEDEFSHFVYVNQLIEKWPRWLEVKVV